jgi:hypothetical protein
LPVNLIIYGPIISSNPAPKVKLFVTFLQDLDKPYIIWLREVWEILNTLLEAFFEIKKLSKSV